MISPMGSSALPASAREVSEAAVERLHARFRFDRRNIYFGATHSHCSLGGWGEGLVGEAFAGGFQPGVRMWMAQQLAEAATAAVPATKAERRRKGVDAIEQVTPSSAKMPAKPRPQALGTQSLSNTPSTPGSIQLIQLSRQLPAR